MMIQLLLLSKVENLSKINSFASVSYYIHVRSFLEALPSNWNVIKIN